MWIERQFSGEDDSLRMIALARMRPDDNLHVVDLPYRLSSWALDDPLSIHLWEDATSGNLVMWAMLQPPMWTLDIVVGSAGSDLYRQALAWAEGRAREVADTPFGHPMWFVSVFGGQSERIRALREAGFADQGNAGEYAWSKVLFRRPASTAPEAQELPEGFVIRPLAGAAEAQAYVDLHRETFESKNMTLEWRQRALRRPEYRPELDLVVVAPNGRLAAFCICWCDPALRAGHVEPMGVGADYRRHGLGRMILCEGIRRLTECGAEHIFVETDNQRDAAYGLYRSVGFEVIQDVRVYRKTYPT